MQQLHIVGIFLHNALKEALLLDLGNFPAVRHFTY